MMSTSRKPAVVTSAVRAPLRSRIALVATGVACRMPETSLGSTPAVRSSVSNPSSTAMAGSRGVDATLWKRRTPARKSSSTKSVKVPPISNATRIERDLLLFRLSCRQESRRLGALQLGDGAGEGVEGERDVLVGVGQRDVIL